MIEDTPKAKKFNASAAESADLVLPRLGIEPGMIIADIGSGGGYYVGRFSRMVGLRGKVYAVDPDPHLHAYVALMVREEKLANVRLVSIAGIAGEALPLPPCDIIFLSNAFHHLADAPSFLREARSRLKPGGKLVVVEWLPGVDDMHHSCLPGEAIRDIVFAAGYRLVAGYDDVLPKQSFNIFTSQDA